MLRQEVQTCVCCASGAVEVVAVVIVRVVAEATQVLATVAGGRGAGTNCSCSMYAASGRGRAAAAAAAVQAETVARASGWVSFRKSCTAAAAATIPLMQAVPHCSLARSRLRLILQVVLLSQKCYHWCYCCRHIPTAAETFSTN